MPARSLVMAMLAQPVARETSADVVGRVVAELENQDSAGRQQRTCLLDQPRVDFDAGGSAEKGRVRARGRELRAEAWPRRRCADVGRIADDQVEAACSVDSARLVRARGLRASRFRGNGCDRDAVAGGVAASDFEGRCGNIGGKKLGVRQFVRESHGEAAGAGADVGDAQRRAGRSGLESDFDAARAQAFERDFDDVFGFRARNQDGRGDFEFESPEFLLAGEVLRRLAGGAASDESEVCFAPWLDRAALPDACRARCGRGRGRASGEVRRRASCEGTRRRAGERSLP